MQHGTLHIDRPAGYEAGNGATAVVHLYGPRGGIIGSTTIDRHDAEQAIARLVAFGAKPRFLERLLDAAEAVLNSGVALDELTEPAMCELAEALHTCDSKRDHRSEFPNITAEV